jgi:hypothetical protein
VNSYDFRSLNDKEFEAVVIDLLSEENGIHIERFKPGKDKGVDGRWFGLGGDEKIVQCKHWVGSGYKKLAKHLKDSELPKLGRLHCSRYIVATSVPLSRDNKSELTSILAPYVLSENDIIGAEDLNDMLGRHPNVERRHYKLWLTSSNTIALLLNNAILGRSRAELEQIREEAPLYAVTADHTKAWEHLSATRVLLLTGDPGIGKTTLARQLVLEHAAVGFELVVLEESISEAEAVFADDAKQLFYFDDFLGRTFLEAIKPKQDSHVVHFMARIARDPVKRFILTSRTNILSQGEQLSDLFADGQIAKNTYELKIGKLTTLDRARILYNHIWHSRLGEDYTEELFREKRYRQVIAHKNYNPRLVAFVVDSDRLVDRTPTDYWKYVLDTFDNPRGVWSHFFSAQLSQDDRDLVYLTVLNGGQIQESELRASFFKLPSQGVNAGLTDHDFQVAVKHTTGSVLNRIIGHGGQVRYTLYNPSIADYVDSQFAVSRLWQYYFERLRTLAALSRLEQLKLQTFFGRSTYVTVLGTLGSIERARSGSRDAYSLRLARLLVTEPTLRNEGSELVKGWMAASLVWNDVPSVSDYLKLFLEASDVVERSVLWHRATELPQFLSDSYLPLDEPGLIAAVLRFLRDLGEIDAHNQIRSLVVSEWSEILQDQVKENGVLASFFDPDDTSDAEKELVSWLRSQLSECGVDLTASEMGLLSRLIDIDSIVEENIALADREDDAADRWREAKADQSNDVSAVDDLFDRSGG